MIRHFTATGIVVHRNATLVHWHQKVGEWLAPGGHIEKNEDPVQATLREVKEETGLNVDIIPTYPTPQISNLEQITPPYTVMVEDDFDKSIGVHQHIDFIYFTTPVPNSSELIVPSGWHWIDRKDLISAKPLCTPNGDMLPPPPDVITLSLSAIDLLYDRPI